MRRLVIALLFATALAAAEPERGKLVENVAARADATQTYTLYLPTNYDAARRVPLLLVFDPGGRATVAAEIFKDAAEEYGWIVISSNQTRSDDDGAANVRAIQALLPEVNRYASDPKRIYAAGFSGTAIFSCAVGIRTGALAGVIAAGGRLVDELPPAKFSFAHYGFAGESDFNNRDMRRIDALLERAGKAHRFQQFAGEHRWFPPELAAEAIGWMELVAMREQLRPRDPSLIAKLYESDAAAAKALEAAGKRVEALQRDREITTTYAGLHATDAEAAAVTRLEADAAVQRELKDIAKWDEFEEHYNSDVFAHIATTFARLRQEDMPPTAAVLAREFHVSDLQRRAKQNGAEGAVGRRLLEALYAQTSFYLTQQFMERREYALAVAVLGVATQIHPDRWPAWYNLGAAQARAGDRRHALDSLEKAASLGMKDRSQLVAQLASDEDLASLRAEPRFQALLASRSQ
jgi:predicted esterase